MCCINLEKCGEFDLGCRMSFWESKSNSSQAAVALAVLSRQVKDVSLAFFLTHDTFIPPVAVLPSPTATLAWPSSRRRIIFTFPVLFATKCRFREKRQQFQASRVE